MKSTIDLLPPWTDPNTELVGTQHRIACYGDRFARGDTWKTWDIACPSTIELTVAITKPRMPLCPECGEKLKVMMHVGCGCRLTCPCGHWWTPTKPTEAEAIEAFLAAVRPETQQP